jgi:hypothetical protein
MFLCAFNVDFLLVLLFFITVEYTFSMGRASRAGLF